MGFYIRRSVSVGPFRFNLSKSGVGLSVGVKGLRIGSGPRGNYVHMGRGGLYFRSSLPVALPSSPPAGSPPERTPAPTIAADPTLEAFRDIESASTLQLTDSSSTALVEQIAAKSRIPRLLPWAVTASVAALVLLASASAPPWSIAVVAVASIALCVVARRRDVVARAVVLMYDLDETAQEAYGQLHAAFESLQTAAHIWHVNATAAVRDRKYHAGASSIVKRAVINLRKGEPPILKTNVEAILLPAGRQLLTFMPDRLILFDADLVAGIDYRNLTVKIDQTTFIEDGTPPSDAKVVGTTWRYVNKGGGPDRRFANNPQLPVALYEELHFESPSGLNELFQCSRLGVGTGLQDAVAGIAKIANEKVAVLPKP